MAAGTAAVSPPLSLFLTAELTSPRIRASRPSAALATTPSSRCARRRRRPTTRRPTSRRGPSTRMRRTTR
jgi:hypothetical protein